MSAIRSYLFIPQRDDRYNHPSDVHNEKIKPMIYNSSPQTFIFKNLFPIIMLGVGIIGFFTLKNIGDEIASNFANAFGIALVWISIFLIQMPFRLKNVEVDENGLIIKTGNGNQIIPFNKINSISKFDLSNPWMMLQPPK